MNIVLLVLSSSLFLSVGFYYVVKGLKDADEDDVVPISDVKEINAISKVYTSEDESSKVPEKSLTEHIVKEAINSPSEETVSNPVPQGDFRINSLTKEIEMLREQLQEQERKAQEKLENIVVASDDLSAEASRDENSPDGAGYDLTTDKEEISKEDYQRLVAENDDLRVQLLEKDGELKEIEERIENLKSQAAVPSDTFSEEKEELESKISELSAQNRELIEENKAIGRVISEKKEMEDQVARQKQTAGELEGQLNVIGEELEELKNRSVSTEQNLMVENKALTAQVMERERLVSRLQEEVETLRNEIGTAHESILKLEGQPQTSGQEESQTVPEEVIEENEKLKKFNQSLIERETLLQYELTKSKAQSVGFEKICEELKIKVETAENSYQKD